MSSIEKKKTQGINCLLEGTLQAFCIKGTLLPVLMTHSDTAVNEDTLVVGGTGHYF